MIYTNGCKSLHEVENTDVTSDTIIVLTIVRFVFKQYVAFLIGTSKIQSMWGNVVLQYNVFIV